jgi:hypothetical protein
MPVYPCWYTVGFGQILWLGLVYGVYLILERRRLIISASIFYLHLFLSIWVFYDQGYYYTKGDVVKAILLATPFFLFIVGQLIFLIGVIKAKRT